MKTDTTNTTNITTLKLCDSCKGTGMVVHAPCSECKGNGIDHSQFIPSIINMVSDRKIEIQSAIYASDTGMFNQDACHDFQNGARWHRSQCDEKVQILIDTIKFRIRTGCFINLDYYKSTLARIDEDYNNWKNELSKEDDKTKN